MEGATSTSFYKKPKNLHVEGRNTKGKPLKNLSIWKTSVTASSQQLGNQSHSFATKTDMP